MVLSESDNAMSDNITLPACFDMNVLAFSIQVFPVVEIREEGTDFLKTFFGFCFDIEMQKMNQPKVN